MQRPKIIIASVAVAAIAAVGGTTAALASCSSSSSAAPSSSARAWPPVTAAMPTGSGLSGQLTAVNDTHGSQVAYNGHLLYTFITDRPGQVTGQGVQNFFVATPVIAPLSGTSAPTGTVPASPASGGYGY